MSVSTAGLKKGNNMKKKDIALIVIAIVVGIIFIATAIVVGKTHWTLRFRVKSIIAITDPEPIGENPEDVHYSIYVHEEDHPDAEWVIADYILSEHRFFQDNIDITEELCQAFECETLSPYICVLTVHGNDIKYYKVYLNDTAIAIE